MTKKINSKSIITEKVADLNRSGGKVKVLYHQGFVHLLISGDYYFSGTRQQVLDILMALKQVVINTKYFINLNKGI